MSTISKICEKAADEVRNVSIDMRGKLDEDEFLSGGLTVIEVTSSDLTLSNRAISSEELTIEDQVVPAAQAVQFKVAGGTPGKKYTVRITVDTTSSPPQRLIENIKIKVIAD